MLGGLAAQPRLARLPWRAAPTSPWLHLPAPPLHQAMPGGFNALRQLYENVQEPLYNAGQAAEGGTGSGAAGPDNPLASMLSAMGLGDAAAAAAAGGAAGGAAAAAGSGAAGGTGSTAPTAGGGDGNPVALPNPWAPGSGSGGGTGACLWLARLRPGCCA